MFANTLEVAWMRIAIDGANHWTIFAHIQHGEVGKPV
jgi:hypothetical protein